jgi:hypothetical protein
MKVEIEVAMKHGCRSADRVLVLMLIGTEGLMLL